jgi:hypothetical protein
MEVEYELTRDDLFAFQWRAAFRSPPARRAMRKAYLYWFLALLLFSLLPAVGAHGFDGSRASFAFMAVAFPLGALFHWLMVRRQTRRAILELLQEEKPGRGLLGWHRVGLGEAGLTEMSAVNDSRTAWAGVDRVEQDGEYVFIYTTPHAAHIIPKRAFGSPAEAESFYHLASASKALAA